MGKRWWQSSEQRSNDIKNRIYATKLGKFITQEELNIKERGKMFFINTTKSSLNTLNVESEKDGEKHEWKAFKCFYFSRFFRTFSCEKFSRRHRRRFGKIGKLFSLSLFLKFLFLNKCFSHQSYCGCVVKTPAVGVSSFSMMRNCFLPRNFSLESDFHLICEAQRASSQMISILSFDGSLHPL